MDIDEYLKNKTREDYQRDNFDDFLRKIKFSYAVPTIHIAGTNGKGSTVNFIKSIYQNAGYKVGSFSTPDVFSETIKINDSPIDETYAESIINEYDHLFNKYDLSGFEIQTFIALKYFIDQNVNIAIVECGMGGEIDATNVFTPILSIITTISIEHSAFLGLSLSEIAFHKAGIIKSRVPCLVGKLNEEAMTVIFNKCKEEKSELHIVDDYFNVQRNNFDLSFDFSNLSNLKISSASTYEIEAACLAIQAVNLLYEQFKVSENDIRNGLLTKCLKCRFEVISKEPLIILDGAHNPEAVHRLREEIDKLLPGKRLEIVFASFKDKNIALMLPELSLIGNIHLTTFNHTRARSADDYFLYLNEYDFKEDYKNLINTLKEDTSNIILITGSLAFTYEVRNFLNGK
ncbi:MAG: hypothetical protein MJ225_00665 [Bacilli bacterium]|nr:hypothetical protein [Bacilli bacterium]